MAEKIKKWYAMGLWNQDMVNIAVMKGILTDGQADNILNQEEQICMK